MGGQRKLREQRVEREERDAHALLRRVGREVTVARALRAQQGTMTTTSKRHESIASGQNRRNEGRRCAKSLGPSDETRWLLLMPALSVATSDATDVCAYGEDKNRRHDDAGVGEGAGRRMCVGSPGAKKYRQPAFCDGAIFCG